MKKTKHPFKRKPLALFVIFIIGLCLNAKGGYGAPNVLENCKIVNKEQKELTPIPDIKANGQDCLINLSTSDTLSVTLALNANGNTNVADWLALAQDSTGAWYYYDVSSQSFQPGTNVTYTGALFDMASYQALTMTGLPAGVYPLYFVIDMAGDGTLTSGSTIYDQVNVIVGGAPDTTAPTSTASLAAGLYSSAQSVSLTCTDNNSSPACLPIHFTIIGTTPTTSSPIYYTPIPITSTTTLQYFCVDAAGNQEPVNSKTYVIDTVAPVTTAYPGTSSSTSALSVALYCTDTGTGCSKTYYTTNGVTPTVAYGTEYSSPITISSTTTLLFFSVDLAGGQESVKTAIYTIDNSAPVTTASPAGGVYSVAGSVTLACIDPESGCSATFYSTDGSTPNPSSGLVYSSPIPLALPSTTTLKFFSVNGLGIQEQVNTQTYVVQSSQ